MWILPNVGTSHIKIALYTVHLKCTVHSREWWSWMDAVNWPSTFAYLSIASSRVDAFWWMWTCDMKIFALIQVHSLASITKFLVFNLLFPDLWTTHQTILYCPWVFVYYKLRTRLTGSLLQLLSICGWYSNTELTHSWNNLVFFFFSPSIMWSYLTPPMWSKVWTESYSSGRWAVGLDYLLVWLDCDL